MRSIQPKIFIVEDDKYFAHMIQELLRKNNYHNVEIFHKGEDCLKSINENPDMVILDYRLGEVSGMEVLREIRQFNADIQVVFLTAQREIEVAVDSFKNGAIDYLEKNYESLQRLLHHLRQLRQSKQLDVDNAEYRKLRNYLVVLLGLLLGIAAFVSWIFPTLFD